ncbi:type I-E CRISPR-associated protein Cas6/Cse3/CasE [Streptomyces sp. NBC_00287]|uniref:type I-E CRISPR-associated protein Cas6/Cse3/CasE n=1 Tax=Streptomyces sp. NBC_00287 TaxID=2975702 RepID=UPI002E2D2189|nr:type I-E CRISPR-associated protein Cas6/Cse3/CasE [Streptomyces sp. NBC_00287]
MYLTRFPINTARTQARQLLGSPHRLHGAVNMAFPQLPAETGEGPRVLWRVDHTPTGRTNLFIVSPTQPDLTHLKEQAGWPTLPDAGWTTFAYDEFLNSLKEGDVWAFRLTANPMHHIRRETDPPGSPTKRAAHVTPRHQIGWLLSRQQRAGFEVTSKPAEQRLLPEGDKYEVTVHNQLPQNFRKPDGNAQHNVRFAKVTFDGRLRITDLPAFHRTLTHGLGKAKAYGCGLMTLAPLGGR